jgi:hypothetical protein
MLESQPMQRLVDHPTPCFGLVPGFRNGSRGSDAGLPHVLSNLEVEGGQMERGGSASRIAEQFNV